MNNPMTLRTKEYTQTKQWVSDTERQAIQSVIQSSFANVDSAEYFAKYFDSPGPFQRRLRLYFEGEFIVGYCLLTFTDESASTIIRASAGFYPDYRKGGNTFQFSITESFKCWLRRPWRKLYYADTMLSPAMYRAIAKRTGIIWPHPNRAMPHDLFERFNPAGDVSPATASRCLVSVNRTSKYTADELEAFKASEKAEIQYYQQLNPDFHKGTALFVIIPVHFRQLLVTAFKQFRLQ